MDTATVSTVSLSTLVTGARYYCLGVGRHFTVALPLALVSFTVWAFLFQRLIKQSFTSWEIWNALHMAGAYSV